MSDKDLKRIKQIRKKTNSGYSESIPIGTQGLLVDMISQLDLEEQIRLGGNHYTSIFQTSLSTDIKEWYFSKPKGNLSLEDMSNYVTYSVSVSITKASENNIVSREWEDESEIEYLLSGTDDNGPFDLVDRYEVDQNNQIIEIYLYKGDFNKLIHSKIINIYEDSETGQTVINQQVDSIYENPLNPEDDQEQNHGIQPEQEEQNSENPQEVDEG